MTSGIRPVCVGVADAGVAAASRAREVDPLADVTVIYVDDYANFSTCGLPCLLSGEVPDWRNVAHRSSKDLDAVQVAAHEWSVFNR